MIENPTQAVIAADSIRGRFPEFSVAPPGEWQHFVTLLRPRRFEKGAYLQRQGEAADRLFFLIEGAACLQHLADGRAVNLGFDFDGRFVAAYDSILTGEPSTFGIFAIEPCTCLQLLAADLRSLYERDPCWDRIGRLLAERYFVAKARKEDDIRSRSPTDRYRRIVRERPDLATRVPLYELARYLGITPETLSRIRSRMEGTVGS